MPRTVSVLILCEDVQARVFILDALEEIDPDLVRRARVVPYPGGVFRQGESGTKSVDGYTVYSCGSQHVRENYPILVEQRRQKSSTMRTMGCRLIVQIDVDNAHEASRTVADRLKELHDACLRASIAPPGQQEEVAHLIPRRNIETWIEFFLKGPPVDETARYAHLARPSDAEPAAIAFAKHEKANTVPTGAPPSLIQGLSEFRRVI